MSGKREGKRVGEKKGTESIVPMALGKGSVTAVLVMAAFLLAGAGAVSAGVLGQEMMTRWGLLSCVAGGLSGGWAAMRKERRWALPLGIGTGGILFLLLLLTGVVFYEGNPAAENMPPVLCACLCGGGMAGILGRKNKKKRKR